tara:strand:+ start:238 stop:429 length:192 start_codon:yes stop_codon:yes gene_type:complete
MAKKQPMYGSEASTDNAAIADLKTDHATTDIDTDAEIVAVLNLEFAKVNQIIAALEKFGIIKT